MEIFFRMRAVLAGRPPQNLEDNEEPMLSPVAYGLLLATTILAVVVLILVFEKFWIKIKGTMVGSKEYQTNYLNH